MPSDSAPDIQLPDLVVTPEPPKSQQQQYDADIAAGRRPVFPPGQRFNSRGEAIARTLQPALPGASFPAGPVLPPSNSLILGGGAGLDPRGMIPHIRAAAAKYGVDPAVAIRVARSEGLGTFLGDSGKSGGAFQLYTGGGLGNEFQKETGLDPLDPANEPATIDWAMKNLPRTGWEPYHGAQRVGVANREGIGGSKLGLDGPAPDLRTPANPLTVQATDSDASWIPPASSAPASPWARLLALSALAQGAQVKPVQVKYDPRVGAQPVAVQEPSQRMEPGLGGLGRLDGMRIPRSAEATSAPAPALADSSVGASAIASGRGLPGSPATYVARVGMRPYYANE